MVKERGNASPSTQEASLTVCNRNVVFFVRQSMLLGTFKHVKLKRARFSNWWDPLGSPAWGFPWLRRAT